MRIASQPTIDPRRPISGLPAVEEPRIVTQRRAAQQMLERLKADARLAAIMVNPIFAPHANAIAARATARAIYRYETEVPRQDMDTLLAQEHGRARQAILALPKQYYEVTADAAEATGDAIVAGAKTTGQAVATGALALVAGLQFAGQKVLQGLGALFTGIGKLYMGAGSTLNRWGEA